jgi:hypothetical protein
MSQPLTPGTACRLTSRRYAARLCVVTDNRNHPLYTVRVAKLGATEAPSEFDTRATQTVAGLSTLQPL